MSGGVFRGATAVRSAPRPAARRPQSVSLADKLRSLADGMSFGSVTLFELREQVGPDGFMLLVIFLALFFMVPVQIPGLSVVFGGAIALIGVSRLRGRTVWLPRRMGGRAFSAEKVRSALLRGLVWLHRLEYVSRTHRLELLVAPRIVEVANCCGIILGGLLLMAPIILVPFSNTLPALGVLFLAIGMLQRDGLCVLYGHVANAATLVYFGSIVAGGHAAFDEWMFHNGGGCGVPGC